MKDKKDNKFYWSAGVTKNEVIESLNDNRPSIFRNQANRRALVLVAIVCLFSLSLVFAFRSLSCDLMQKLFCWPLFCCCISSCERQFEMWQMPPTSC